MDDIARERSYPTPVAHSPWLPLLLMSLASQKHSPDTKPCCRPKYDYIVVGAGSAGSVVASRLSEVPCVTVLLLEAGKAPPLLTDVPAFDFNFYGTDVDWQYETVPQKYAAGGFYRKIIAIPRGKMLGGSSSINGNQFVRGNRKDFDDWAAAGALGWNFTEVLPYFKKLEDYQVPKYRYNGYHGFGGPVTDSLINYKAEIKEPLFAAHRLVGLDEHDLNGPIQTGSHDPQLTILEGQRCSTAKAYLVPKEKASNLDIVVDAFVTKVVINDQRVAIGVLVDVGGRSRFVEAGREVIVSAGAVNTPQLLMLSGIGPADHLASLGIPVVADLAVGANLQDQPLIQVPFEISGRIKTFDEKMNDANTMFNYIRNRSGIWTAGYGIAVYSDENESYSNPAIDYPSLKTGFIESSIKSYKKRVVPKIYNQVYAPYENKTVVFCVPTVLHTKTRGYIKLRSANPYEKPIIDLQYLEHPMDAKTIVEGMEFCHRIFSSQPMQLLGARPLSTLFPGCEDVAFSEDLYFSCVAKLVTFSCQHLCGTAKMGDPKDCTTVLDPQLRVKTIRGLRVVDASVMPTVTSANTNVPTIMIGEKAADMIKSTVHCWNQAVSHLGANVA